MNNQREMNVSADFDTYAFNLPTDFIQQSAIDVKTSYILKELRELQAHMNAVLPQKTSSPELKLETNINTPVAAENEDTDKILRDWALHILNHHFDYLINNQDEILTNLTTQNYDITANQRRMLKAISLDAMSRMAEGVEKKQFQKHLNTAIPFGS
jgi:hypothetical protein